ncbi:MAG TPA: FtsX-like permease family protein [Rhodothermales bacterium]|nr:FtsX-like permease family protein [Rhodothermales bacterium]
MFDPWTWKMAWRDSRGSRRRLLLFLSSMVIGVAALVAINSFGENLEQAVDDEARTLLGADLSMESDRPFSRKTEALIDSLGGEQARRVSFASMSYFPKGEHTRLATVRALEGDYPFYGSVETDPPEAASSYLEGPNALVDGSLMQEFDVAVGDSVRIGEVTYHVAGELLKTPRESAAMMLFSPRIYVPLAHVDSSLLSFGSRVEYETFFLFESERNLDVEALADTLRPRMREMGVGVDTIAEEQENWGEGLGNLYRFLSLVGFIALLLGGLGVASAIHVYVKQRLETVAVLRCVGAKSGRTFWIYLHQATVMGIVGSVVGCLLGLGIQMFLPQVVADFLPVEVDFTISWPALLLGFGIGVSVTLLFALLPLLTVRKVSPLRALRAAFDESGERRDPWRWVVYGLIAAGLVVFASVQAQDVVVGLSYAGGVVAVFGLLALTAKGLMWLARRFFPSGWSYPWRQGLANLYRPNNQTVLLMLALGLGTFLIMTLVLVERSLVSQIQFAGGNGRPDLILFDVQPDQVEGVEAILTEQNLPVIDRSPIVTMRLKAVKGRTIADMREDTTAHVTWAHRREYRSSYRDHLSESEELVAGEFQGSVAEDAEVIPISIEEDIATEELGVTLGDTLVWDVQGVPVTSVISSIRRVDWQRMQTNFFVLFPEGAINDAPQMSVVMTRTETDEAVARLQSAIVQEYPNVSSVSLSLILSVFDQIFDRITFVIRFMALFSVLTGLFVLAGAVMVSRYQRIEESVLLKTLGASRKQVFKIQLIEYLFLGILATVTGLALALAASWALVFFVFDVPLVAAPVPLLLSVVVVTGLTIAIGLFNSRGIYARPPLEVLRAAG